MLKSSLCDQSDAYTLVKEIISVTNTYDHDKKIVFKYCAPFTDCISKINNTQIDNAKDVDVVLSMFNLAEYSNNYSKTSGSLWQYYRDEPALTFDGAINNFPGNSASFKFKQEIRCKTEDNSTKLHNLTL